MSLSPLYQQGISADEYEVILVDNGSPEPLSGTLLSRFPNVTYVRIPPGEASRSPGPAANEGVARGRAPIVCILIDGARMITPGVLQWGLRAGSLSPEAVVDVRGFHLGRKVQMESIKDGYSPEVEQRLLESIGWPQNGYRLFEIAVPASYTPLGFLGQTTESNCIFLHRPFFLSTGGFDERYQSPGGGLVNLDFFWRVVMRATLVFTLLGESNFHQMHGGAASGLTTEQLGQTLPRWAEEYERLSRPSPGQPPPYEPILFGHFAPESLRWLTLNIGPGASQSENTE